MSRTVRSLALLVSALLVALGVQLPLVSPAEAACGLTVCGGEQGGGGAVNGVHSDGTESATYGSSAGMSCIVYGNGNGMGNYCVSLGHVPGMTLQQRFGGQKFQRCRYSEMPKGVPMPFNANPGKGRYMMMSCLTGIDMDTQGGGPDKSLQMYPVWVPEGTDTSILHNALSDLIWNLVLNRSNQLPVPFMITRPNPVPVVGVPTYFTFRWIDPRSGTVRAMGKYADDPNGGPFMELNTHGMLMRAEATRIRIDPNQKGIPAVVCDPSTPYTPGAAPADQPAGACSITFPRSSASAEKYATEPIPELAENAFYVSVEVDWRITYGQPGDMRELGDGFAMRLRQVLPVQEIQAPNQPPAVIY